MYMIDILLLIIFGTVFNIKQIEQEHKFSSTTTKMKKIRKGDQDGRIRNSRRKTKSSSGSRS